MPLGAFKLNSISSYLAPSGRTAKTVQTWGYDDFQIHNSPSKFGRSLFFAGTTVNNAACGLETPMTDEFKWHLGNFTMEAWVYPIKFDTGSFAILGNMGSDGWTYNALGFSSSGQLQFKYQYDAGAGWTTATVIESGTSGVANSWQHIALTHSGGVIKLWHNGVEKASASVLNTPGYNYGNIRPFTVGWSGAGFRGFIDEVRVSKIQRYTTTFTPSSTGFSNDSNTVYLLHLDHNTLINPGGGTTEVLDDASNTSYSPATNPTSVTAVSIIDSVTSTGSTITIPSYAAVNDYALLFDTSTTTTLTVPSGFTQISTSTTTGIRSTVSYKKLVSGDLNSTITGMAGTTSKILVILKPNAPVTSITISTPQAQATSTTPSGQSFPGIVGLSKPVMGFAHYTSSLTGLTTRGGNGFRMEIAGGTTRQYVKIWSFNYATPADANITQNDNGVNSLQSFYIRFA